MRYTQCYATQRSKTPLVSTLLPVERARNATCEPPLTAACLWNGVGLGRAFSGTVVASRAAVWRSGPDSRPTGLPPKDAASVDPENPGPLLPSESLLNNRRWRSVRRVKSDLEATNYCHGRTQLRLPFEAPRALRSPAAPRKWSRN